MLRPKRVLFGNAIGHSGTVAKYLIDSIKVLAPRAGFEPATIRLTVDKNGSG